MGGGTWSAATYRAVTSAKVDSGTTFGYDFSAKRSGIYKAHESLDPKFPKAYRESRDSVEHPNSVPIIVGFDSTGSMGSVPRVVQKKLTTLFNLLLDKNYVDDPQVAVATYGDVHCDRVPLQFAQFESDNRIDDSLDNMFLEGGGGGNHGESANMLLYYAATHIDTDAFEKRGKKGYLFIIADEVFVDLRPEHVKEHIGDDQPLIGLSNEEIAEEVSKKWEVRILLIDNAAAKYQRSQEFYSNLFGPDAVLVVQDPDTIAESIAAVLGFEEGRDRAAIVDDLTEAAGREVALRVSALVDKRDSGSTVSRGLR